MFHGIFFRSMLDVHIISFFSNTIILFEVLIELVLSFEYLFCSGRSAPEPVLKLQKVPARASSNLCFLQYLVFRHCLQSI